MSTPDFFCSRLDAMIDMQHPLAVLAGRLPWARIEAALAPKFTHQDRPVRQEVVGDLLGEHAVEFGGGVSNAGRPRLPIRLMRRPWGHAGLGAGLGVRSCLLPPSYGLPCPQQQSIG